MLQSEVSAITAGRPASSLLCSCLLGGKLLPGLLLIICPMSSKSPYVSPLLGSLPQPQHHRPGETSTVPSLCPGASSLYCVRLFHMLHSQWLFSDTFVQVCKLWGQGFCLFSSYFPGQHRTRHTADTQVFGLKGSGDSLKCPTFLCPSANVGLGCKTGNLLQTCMGRWN